MFERMLVGLNSSPHSPTVLAAAKDLAVKSGSVVMVAHIRDVAVPLAMAASAGRPGMRRDVPPLEDEHIANRLVEDAVQPFREAGVDAEGRVGHSVKRPGGEHDHGAFQVPFLDRNIAERLYNAA